jgi:tRNA(Met) C34 N-acetyltransferase TmcA
VLPHLFDSVFEYFSLANPGRYYVCRDTLFSYHRASEGFLQRLVGLFVASHYKNSPDDLLLMSDAPAHHLFVLLGPQQQKSSSGPNALPEILCAVQVCLEGGMSSSYARSSLGSGVSGAGDLIPWTIATQFQDPDFATLRGARIVRIATNPDYQRVGVLHYGYLKQQQDEALTLCYRWVMEDELLKFLSNITKETL